MLWGVDGDGLAMRRLRIAERVAGTMRAFFMWGWEGE